jgi:glycosyltransferase involved in cell wall biosynthesis
MNPVDISIVTPTFNEELSIEKCVRELARVMESELPNVSYEHIICDNASSDETIKIVQRLVSSYPNLKLVVNSRNIGAPRNIYRGLSKTSGLTVIPMLPADLQDPPELIPMMYQKWKTGNLVIFGQRINRQESLAMRTFRGIYYRLIRTMSQAKIPINAGDFMLIDRKVADAAIALNDQNPYLRGVIAQMAVKSEFIQYTWAKREQGKSKATPFLLIDTAINGLVSTSRVPARLALLGGFAFSLIGVLTGIWSLLVDVFSSNKLQHGIPTLIVAIFFIGGVQLFFLGLIGEYVLSIHGQIRPEPPVFDSLVINFKANEVSDG